jgi:hypothetical protein
MEDFTGGILGKNLRIIVQKIRIAAILPIRIYKGTGMKDHLETKFPGQLQKDYQVLGMISGSVKIIFP